MSADPFASVRDLRPRRTISWLDATGKPLQSVVGPGCINIALENASRSRKPDRYPQQKNYQGFYWMTGSGEHVWYESMQEYSALMALDHMEHPVAVSSQPCCIRFADRTCHFPDFFAVHPDGTRHLYDVRSEELVDEKDGVVFKRTAEVCEEVGWGYRVLQPVEGFQRHNLEWLAGYRHPWNALHPDDEMRVLDYLQHPASLRHTALVLNLRQPERGLPGLYHLMWNGTVQYDHSVPLNWNTELEAPA